MRTARTVMAAAVTLALMASFGAMAQKAPDKAGQITGEMSPPQKADAGVVKKEKPGPSTTTRSEQTKEAMAATKAGMTTTGECDPEQKMDQGLCKKVVTKSKTVRSEVRKDAATAAKAGQTTTGEMSPQQKKDEGVVKK